MKKCTEGGDSWREVEKTSETWEEKRGRREETKGTGLSECYPQKSWPLLCYQEDAPDALLDFLE